MRKYHLYKGFTLIELSVVILIIGLLIGGIATGISLVKQAQLRAIMSDLTTYQVAYNSFKARYDKKPGDFNTASLFWSSITAGDPDSCAITSAANCNGNGNNIIEHGTTIATNESLKAWRHMYLAKMISAGVDQLSTSTGAITIGTQAPASKRTGVGYMISGGGVSSAITIDQTGILNNPFGSTGTNALWVGKSTSQTLVPGAPSLSNALTPEEAFQIDTKMDDAKGTTATGFTGAWTGIIRTRGGIDELIPTDCISAAPQLYNIGNNGNFCVIGMALE